MEFVYIFLLVSCANLITNTHAYGSGAPPAACEQARPMHHDSNGTLLSPLPSDDNPFSFSIIGTQYTPGGTLQVSIESGSSETVHGFFLQARPVGSGSSAGSFASSLPGGSQIKTCNRTDDTVTHTNPDSKTGLDFTWQAPSEGVGPIQFVGAVALDHDNFYIGITSETLEQGNAGVKLASFFSAIFLTLAVTMINVV